MFVAEWMFKFSSNLRSRHAKWLSPEFKILSILCSSLCVLKRRSNDTNLRRDHYYSVIYMDFPLRGRLLKHGILFYSKLLKFFLLFCMVQIDCIDVGRSHYTQNFYLLTNSFRTFGFKKVKFFSYKRNRQIASQLQKTSQYQLYVEYNLIQNCLGLK